MQRELQGNYLLECRGHGRESVAQSFSVSHGLFLSIETWCGEFNQSRLKCLQQSKRPVIVEQLENLEIVGTVPPRLQAWQLSLEGSSSLGAQRKGRKETGVLEPKPIFTLVPLPLPVTSAVSTVLATI